MRPPALTYISQIQHLTSGGWYIIAKQFGLLAILKRLDNLGPFCIPRVKGYDDPWLFGEGYSSLYLIQIWDSFK